MARLPIPQSTVRPQQGRSPRRADAQDFGGDMGLSQLGSALSSLDGALDARQEKQDNYEVERRISEERLGAAVDFDRRMKEAPLGAPGFVEELNERTESHRENVLSEYRESGMSEAAVQKLDLKMRGLQQSLQSKALTFKAQSYGAKVKSDVEGSVKNYSQIVAMDPSAFEDIRSEQREMIEAIPDLDATQRASLLKYSEDQISIAAGLALAQKYPQFVLASLSGGDDREHNSSTYAEKPADNLVYVNKNKTRNKPVTQRVGYILSKAAATINPDLEVFILSGGQDGINDDIGHGRGKGLARIGSQRHDHGDAGDVVLVLNGKKLLPSRHKELYAQYLENAAALGAEGIGHYAWGVHIGGGSVAAWGPNKSKDTLDPEFGTAIARGRKRFATSGGKFTASVQAHSGKTGNPVLDSLGASSRQRLVSAAQTALNQQSAAARNELSGRVENQLAAAGIGEAYAGPAITIEDFYAASPLNIAQAEADFETFQSQLAVAEKINDFKVMPPENIQAELEGLLPTDTSDPAYAEQLKIHSVATEAAQKTLESRAQDPASYVQQTMPYVAEKFEMVDDAAEPDDRAIAMQSALSAMQDAQAHIGIPDGNIALLPSSFVKNTTDQFNDINLPFEERMGAFVSTVLSTSDPTQQRQIFEQFVRKDSEFAKFEAAVEAQARGDTGAARRLFQAGMFDPEKLPGKIVEKDADINATISEIVMEPGGKGDAVYGFSANVVGNEETARRDMEIFGDAVRFRMRGGASLEDAVELASKDIYGDIEVIEGSFFSGPEMVVAVPKGTDVNAFRRGANALMPHIRDAANSSISDIPKDAPPELVGPYKQQRMLEELRVEDAIDNGEWRVMEDGFAFIDTATGTPISNNGLPLVFSLDEILEAEDAP